MKLSRLPDGNPEIFLSLQGEGRHAGRPSVFIRASLCNLHCHWCDTPYTWNWEDSSHEHESGAKYRRSEEIVDLPPVEVRDRVLRHPCRNYVFTGGEPLLQERAWLELMDLLEGHYEIETNGTLLPSPEFLERIDQLNVSPKLANSRVAAEARVRPEALRALARCPKADFKFVVGGAEDFAEAAALVSEFALPPDRVFLMPQARTVTELDARAPRVASLALEHGFRFSDRLHLRLYGETRGT